MLVMQFPTNLALAMVKKRNRVNTRPVQQMMSDSVSGVCRWILFLVQNLNHSILTPFSAWHFSECWCYRFLMHICIAHFLISSQHPCIVHTCIFPILINCAIVFGYSNNMGNINEIICKRWMRYFFISFFKMRQTINPFLRNKNFMTERKKTNNESSLTMKCHTRMLYTSLFTFIVKTECKIVHLYVNNNGNRH